MKNLRFALTAIALSVAAFLVVPVGTANAAPAGAAKTAVSAKIGADGKSVVLSIRNGAATINTAATELQIRDGRGAVVTSVPLSGSLDGFTVPLRSSVSADRSTVTLVPVVSAEHRALVDAGRNDAAKKRKGPHLTKQQRYDIMWKELNKGWRGNTPLYTLIGGLIGFLIWTIPGAAIGAAIGAYIGYGQSNPKAWPAVVAWFNA